MLPFLADPWRYIHSPTAQLELAHLRRRLVKRAKGLRALDGLLILLCLWVATIPLRMYVTHANRSWIFLMMAVITGLHFTVWLRTLLLASNSIAREHTPGHWEVFVLTGLDARQIILGKWWAVIRYTALSHILVAFMRLGLALAYTQYMHAGFNPMKCPFGGAAFCHMSWGFEYVANGINLHFPYTELQPPLWKAALALVILIVFALLEAALLSSIGIVTALIAHRNIRMFLAILVRGILFIGAAGSIIATEFNGQIWDAISGYECISPYYPDTYIYMCPDVALIMETTQIGLATFGDNGNFIATMVMRPVGNDLFVFRNVAGSGGIGVILYLLFLWFNLRLAQILIIRQKALGYNSR